MHFIVVAALALSTLHARPTDQRASNLVAVSAPVDSVGARDAARGVLYALYANDSAAFRRWSVPERGSEVLLGAQRVTADELTRLRAEIAALRLTASGPLTLDGLPAHKSADGTYPIGSKGMLLTQIRDKEIVVPVLLTDDGWKVDVRFWLAGIRLAFARPDESSPELRAKAFLFYILARRTERLSALSATPIDASALTKGNDLPDGDLDVVLSLCEEMPVVRARAGERVRLPSGELVTANGRGDTLVLIGLMGPIEVPFVVRRVAGEWKVDPQRYFEMLRAVNAL